MSRLLATAALLFLSAGTCAQSSQTLAPDAERHKLRAELVERTLSEAATHMASGGAARANLKYEVAIESYKRAVALFGQVRQENLSDGQRRQQLLSYEALGDLHLASGNLAEARKAFERQQALAGDLVRAEPANPDWQAFLANSRFALGGVILKSRETALSDPSSSEREAALAHYRAALDIREMLARNDPRSARRLSDLAIASDRLGGMMTAVFDDGAALELYRKGLDASQRLAALDTGNADHQREVAIGLRKVGWSLWQMQRRDEAHSYLDRRLEVAVKAQAAQPGRASLRADVMAALNEIADMRKREGDLGSAAEAYGRALATAIAFAEEHPSIGDDAFRASGAAISLGDILSQERKPAQAAAFYTTSLAWIEKAATLAPGDATTWRRKSLIHNRIGDRLQADGDLKGAISAYRDGLAAIERAVVLEPADAGFQADRSYGAARLAVAEASLRAQ